MNLTITIKGLPDECPRLDCGRVPEAWPLRVYAGEVIVACPYCHSRIMPVLAVPPDEAPPVMNGIQAYLAASDEENAAYREVSARTAEKQAADRRAHRDRILKVLGDGAWHTAADFRGNYRRTWSILAELEHDEIAEFNRVHPASWRLTVKGGRTPQPEGEVSGHAEDPAHPDPG